MSEPTKDELRKEIAAILKDANLEETAAKKVRLQLEANLKCDLSARKKEVDDLVMEYVNAQDESGDEEEEDDEEEEEAPKKKASKKKQESEDEEEEEDEEEDSEDDKKKKGKRGAPAKRGPAKKKKRGSDSEEESEGSDGGSDDDYKPNKGAKGSAKKAAGRKKKGGSDSDSDEDWKRPKAAKVKKAAGAKKGGGKGTGFTRPYNLSPELAKICGAEALPRHEVVKKVWTIIKERNLYDPKNKQYAICDSELQTVIGVKRFRTFGMLKYLKPHFLD